MKRLILLVAFFAVACNRTPPPAAPTTNVNLPPQSPQTPPVPPVVITITHLQDLEKKLTGQYEAIESRIADLQKERETDRSEILKTTTNLINNAVTPLATKVALTQLSDSLTASDKRFETEINELRSRQIEHSAALTEIRGQIVKTQADLLAELNKVSERIGQQERLAQQAFSNSNLALASLNEIADKKVGGFLGIGRKELLPEALQERISIQVQAPSAAVYREGIIAPNK